MLNRLRRLGLLILGPNGLSGALGPALWISGAAALAFQAAAVRHLPYFAQDLDVGMAAAGDVLHHRSLYALHPDLLPYLYPPPSAVALAPFTVLSPQVAERCALLVGVVALVMTAHASARLVVGPGTRLGSVSGCALLLVALWQPSHDGLSNVNSTLLLAPVVPFFLALTLRRRHLTAAVLLGVSLTLKPLLLPLLLVPLLYRQPRGAALAVGIPVLTTLASLPFIADGDRFFSAVVPRLLSGDAGRLGAHNMSLANLPELAGVDAWLTLLVRGCVGLLSVGAAVAIWRSSENETLRLVETTGVLMIGFLSVGGTNESHYQLTLVPLVVSMVAQGSHLLSAAGGLGVLLISYSGPLIYLTGSGSASASLWRAMGLVLMLLAITVSVAGDLVARPPSRAPAERTPAAPAGRRSRSARPPSPR